MSQKSEIGKTCHAVFMTASGLENQPPSCDGVTFGEEATAGNTCHAVFMTASGLENQPPSCNGVTFGEEATAGNTCHAVFMTASGAARLRRENFLVRGLDSRLRGNDKVRVA